MKKQKYNYKRGMPKLSVNKSNLKILSQTSNKIQGSLITLDIPGKASREILKPWGQQKTEWQEQFLAKQEVKTFYGNISEKQLGVLSAEARANKSSVIDLLEQRLDVIIFRLKWTRSIFESRQIIRHGFISLNGKTIKQFGKRLKVGDVLNIKKFPYQALFTRLNNPHFSQIPPYLFENKGEAYIIRTPREEDVELPLSFKFGKLKAYCAKRH